MKLKRMEDSVEIPGGMQASIENSIISIKGSKGELKKSFRCPTVSIEKKDNKLIVFAENATKREKKMIGSFIAHIKNMVKGAKEGHKYRLKICSGHFPMNVSMSGKDFIVKNFLGEKIPRVLRLKEGVSVKIDGQEVVVDSCNKELAGQTAADIEKLTTIKGRDRRVFQDGIYIINKDGKDMMV
ncbi:50S ribosomal protein L6 [Candidatus Woesearchaeota archaeon CG10_big_fil_rev_8_21_14_0_10_44_13]|nr:MAG: 50S ribosomal protein L6 [Candidatus Woesearchaeota archaeon CG10_big_fil_rev_8_21_14_0_10_44_13]